LVGARTANLRTLSVCPEGHGTGLIHHVVPEDEPVRRWLRLADGRGVEGLTLTDRNGRRGSQLPRPGAQFRSSESIMCVHPRCTGRDTPMAIDGQARLAFPYG